MVRYACVSLIGTAISLLSLVSLAWGGFNEGVAAYNRGDYPTAYREFLPLAQRGDARAQANVGRLYHEGHGVPQDYAEAVKWFRKAADQGYTGSQFQLGSLYSHGTMRKPSSGTAKLPSRATTAPRLCSAPCMRGVRGFRRTMCRPICGSISPPHSRHLGSCIKKR
jgi:Sel1 repeat